MIQYVVRQRTKQFDCFFAWQLRIRREVLHELRPPELRPNFTL